MSYTKHNFQSGEKLYASQLNAMDDQIALNESRIDEIEENATVNYNNLTNKPSLNGVTLSGNMTSADLGIPSAEGIPDMVDDWLDENISNPDSPPLDRSLSSSSAAAPADLVGEELTNIKQDLSDMQEIVGGILEPVSSTSITGINLASGATKYSSSNGYKTDYIAIKNSKKCIFNIKANRSGEFRFGFSTAIPANNVAATYISALSISGTGTGSKEYTASADGYVSVSYYNDLLNTLTVLRDSDTILEVMESTFEEMESTLDERLETDKTLTITDKAADAKTVGDALQLQNEYTYGDDVTKEASTVNNINLQVNGVKYTSGNGYDTQYFSVLSNEVIDVEITAARNGEFRFGFSASQPALNVPAQYLDRLSINQNQKKTFSYIPTKDGILSFSYYNNLISNVSISAKSGGANKILKDSEANISNIFNIVDPIKTQNDFIRTTTNHDVLRLLRNAKKKMSSSSSVADPLALVHFSDIHGDSGALQRIMSDVEYLGLIDDVICTGDMVKTAGGAIESWWEPTVMTCIGNHDSAINTPAWDYNYYDMAQRAAWYIEPFVNSWENVVYTTGKSYYYKDYSSQKIRLIVLDGQLYQEDIEDNTEQHSWFTNLLSNAITSNLHVLIAIHGVYNGANVVNCSFSRYGATTMPGVDTMSYIPESVVTAVTTAKSSGLNFIGYICGHKHADAIFKATETQIGYCITCAYSINDSMTIGIDQYRSANVDAYNIVVINTANTLVKLIRGGGTNVDVYMRPRVAITFNYSTGEKVAEIL